MALTRTRFSQSNTAVAKIQDPITVLNSGSVLANVDVGFLINRDLGSSSNVALFWQESSDEFVTALTSNAGVSDANLTITSYANLRVGTFFGNIGGGTSQANTYISGSLIPSSNVAYDLGTDGRRFRDLWLSGTTLHMGDQRLTVTNGEWRFTTPTNTVVLGYESTVANLTVTGNLNLQGSSTTFDSNNLTVQDSIIELHTLANLAALTGDDGRDIGLKFHYYKTQDEHAFLGWSNTNGYLEWYDSGREGVGNVFTGNTYGGIKSGTAWLANSTPSTSTTTGALRVSGGVGIAGNLYIAGAGDVSANIGTIKTNLGQLDANVSAYQTYANANAVAQAGSITSLIANAATQHTAIASLDANVGTVITEISSIVSGANANTAAYLLTATGNIAAGNLTVTGNVYGGIVPTAIFKDVYIGSTAVSLARGTGALTVDDFNTTGYAAQANLATLATNATKTTVTSNISSGTAYVTFVNATAGNVDQNINTALTYNPNSGNLTAYGLVTTTGLFWANGTAFSSSSFGNVEMLANLSGTTPVTIGGNLTVGGNLIVANVVYQNAEVVTTTEVVQGNIVAAATTTSTSATTGALVVKGGAGIAGNVYANRLYVTTDIFFAGNNNRFTANTANFVFVTESTDDYVSYNIPYVSPSGTANAYRQLYSDATGVTFNPNNNTLSTFNIFGNGAVSAGTLTASSTIIGSGNIVAASNTASTTITTGALVVTGGTGIGGQLWIRGIGGRSITATGTIAITGTNANLQLPNGATIKDTSGDAVAFGQTAGSTSQGSSAVAIGFAAGQASQGIEAVAIGYFAGDALQGTQSVAIGKFAGSSSQGSSAVAIGDRAGQYSQGTLSVAIGQFAGNASQGTNAVAVGERAAQYSQSSYAVAVGSLAGNSSQGQGAVAVGERAAQYSQSSYAVAVGVLAGNSSQGQGAVAIGVLAGFVSQGSSAVAIGSSILGSAGQISQGQGAVAIGVLAGYDTQGKNSIAIGARAGYTLQGNNSIIINATGANLNATTANTFTVSPIRNDVANVAEVVFYNTTSKEVTYGNTINLAGNIQAGNITVTSNVYANAIYTTTGIRWAGNGVAFSSSGTGLTYTANIAPPTSGNVTGDQWYSTITNVLYEYLDDGTSKYWVDIQSPTIANTTPISTTDTLHPFLLAGM